jgi:hypothetical protein
MATKQTSKADAGEEAATTKAGLPVAVTLDGLRKDYGKAEGERLYHEIALRGGFGDIRAQSFDYAPPLDLSGLKGDPLKAVEEVFASAQTAKE